MSVFMTCTTIMTTAVLLYAFIAYLRAKRDRNPPGPSPLPLLGNLFDLPQDKPWEIFAQWQKQYGDIIYLSALGTRMVVLNSMDACSDLLDKRSTKYSGRPRFVMLDELAGFEFIFSHMDYTPRWRQYRRLFHRYFNENEVMKYLPVQERYTLLFLQRLLTTPEQFLSHIRLLFGETILEVVYDIKYEDNNRTFVELAERAIELSLQAAIPGQFLVDLFPLLKHLPSWFPGANFKRLASEWRQVANKLKDAPFAYAKKKAAEGRANASISMSMLESCSETLNERCEKVGETFEDAAKACAALAYLAGADTTLSTLQTFFMFMANNREVQRLAQEELDALLGTTPNRLPEYQDKSQLPVITSIIKELLRWHNVLPMSVPHVLTEDDEYNGYVLRKGTIIFPNVWHILRDPEIYPDPLVFNPQRWLIESPEGLQINPAIPDPTATFGFGRRICPGRHFALNSLFATVASVLACFDIRALDAQGRSAERVDEVFTSGLLIYPVPYKVSIIPRSSKWAQLIQELDPTT